MFIWILVIGGIILFLISLFACLYLCSNAMRCIKVNKAIEKYRNYLDNTPSYGKGWSYFLFDVYLPNSNSKPFIGKDSHFELLHRLSGNRIEPLINKDMDFISDIGIDNVFVINLDRSTQRLERFVKMCHNTGINNVQRMRGYDGRSEINEMIRELPEFSINDSNGLKEHADFLDMLSYKLLREGEQGCTGSHLYIWKYIYQNKIPIAVVFEDDVCFHPNFANLLTTSWKNRPLNGVLFNFNVSGHEGKGCDKCDIPTWVKNAGNSTTFYIITYEGAKRLLSAFSKKYFPILPCADDVPFMSLNDSYKLYYNNNSAFHGICGNRKCGIVSTPVSQSGDSVIKDVNK